MRKKTVLISAAGGSFFPYVIKLLGSNYRLILTDTSEAVKHLYLDQVVLKVAKPDSMEFETEVKKIITDYQVDYYIPLIDQEISRVLAIAREIKSLKVISPRLEFVQICLDKYRLMKELSGRRISIVDTRLGDDRRELKFPIFVKPIVSTGSRGARKIDNRDQLEAYFQLEGCKRENVLIQEYLRGEEYTVSVTVNNLNKLIAIVPKKIILKKGITQHAVTRRNQEITRVCRKIVDQFHPAGPFNVQLMLIGDEVKIFEINPRFSTTSVLTCEAGINEFALCIESYDREDVAFIDSFREDLFLYRRWKSCFYEDK